MFNESEMV